jgi:hypothetical protein
MFRAFRHARWALAVVCGLGLAVSADAQTIPPSPPVMGFSPAGQPVRPDPVTLAPGYQRLSEIKVEIAWLSDPVTFPYHLAARAEGGNLEIRGYVLNPLVKAQALKVAQKQTELKVRDALRVHPQIALRSVGAVPAELQQAALTALKEEFPTHAAGFHLRCKADGQITITGTIPSYEEKLAVSRRLHRLKGCSCVVNELEVPTVLKDGQAHARVKADGSEMMPLEMVQAQPAIEAGTTAVVQRTIVGPAPGQKVIPGPQGEPVYQVWEPTRTSRNGKSSAVSTPVTTDRYFSTPPTTAAVTPGLLPTPERPSERAAPSLPYKLSGTWTSPYSPTKSSPSTAMVRYTDPPETVKKGKVDETSQKRPVTPVSAATTSRPAKDARKAPRTPAPGEPYVTTGVVTMSVVEKPASTPAKETSKPPAKGMQTRKDQPLSPPAKAAPSYLETRLKQRVEESCRGAARDVEVEVVSPTDLRIRLKVRTDGDNDRVRNLVWSMPELAAYRVYLDVKVIAGDKVTR